ncbi:hypothetical protein GCM10027161_17160 [Microbispora hainanensis]
MRTEVVRRADRNTGRNTGRNAGRNAVGTRMLHLGVSSAPSTLETPARPAHRQEYVSATGIRAARGWEAERGPVQPEWGQRIPLNPLSHRRFATLLIFCELSPEMPE